MMGLLCPEASRTVTYLTSCAACMIITVNANSAGVMVTGTLNSCCFSVKFLES